MLIDSCVVPWYDDLMDEHTMITAARGLTFSQFHKGLLTPRELTQRLAELKLRELESVGS